MHVYIILDSDYRIYKVFSNREKAENYLKQEYCDWGLSISEWEVL